MISFVFSVVDLVGPHLGIYFLDGFNIRDFIIDARPDAATRRFHDTTEDDGRDVVA